MRQQAIFLNKVRTNNAKVSYSSMENMDGVKRNIVTNFLTSTLFCLKALFQANRSSNKCHPGQTEGSIKNYQNKQKSSVQNNTGNLSNYIGNLHNQYNKMLKYCQENKFQLKTTKKGEQLLQHKITTKQKQYEKNFVINNIIYLYFSENNFTSHYTSRLFLI